MYKGGTDTTGESIIQKKEHSMNNYKPSPLFEVITELEQIRYCIIFLDIALNPLIAEHVSEPAACGMTNLFYMVSDRISHSMDSLGKLIKTEPGKEKGESLSAKAF